MKRMIFVSAFSVAILMGNQISYADDHDKVKQLKESDQIVSLEVILRDALMRREGRVIEVEVEYELDRYIYEIEILDAKNVVWEFYYDARDGRFIKQEMDH